MTIACIMCSCIAIHMHKLQVYVYEDQNIRSFFSDSHNSDIMQEKEEIEAIKKPPSNTPTNDSFLVRICVF